MGRGRPGRAAARGAVGALVVTTAASLGGCRACEPAVDGTPDAAVGGDRARDAAAPEPPVDAGAFEEAAAAAPPATPPGAVDAASAACRIAWGPSELPFRGPAALAARGRELDVVVNEGGRPVVHRVPFEAPPRLGAAAVAGPKVSGEPRGVRWPPCVLAGAHAVCPAPGGAVLVGAADGRAPVRKVAEAKGGTRVAAAALPDGRVVVAYLAERRTTEGPTLEAFAQVDDGEAVRISEEGAGATQILLASRPRPSGPPGVVAAYLDARQAMVPMHARELVVAARGLEARPDAVLAVGPPAEAGMEGTLVAWAGGAFLLVPMSREAATFGLALAPVADPPRENVDLAWSMYPQGLSSAAVAAVPGGPGAYVARVRPAEARGEPRVLELLGLDPQGAMSPLFVLPSPGPVTDVAVAVDAFGAVWIHYGSTRSTARLLRVACGR